MFVLFIIKVDESIDVIKLFVGGAEFRWQGRGGGTQRFLSQNRIHLSLDGRFL